jgi:hypothetical protein
MAKTPISKRPGTAAYKRRQARIRLRTDRARQQNLLAPRTYKDIQREGKAAGELEFGPAQRAKEAEIRGAQTFAGQRLPTLYEQYRQDVAAAAQRAQDAYATAQQQMAQSQQGIQQQYGQDQARRAAESQQQAAVTGAPVSAPPEASQAMLAQSNGQAAFGGLLGARRAEETSFYGQIGAAGTKRQIESETSEQRRQRELGAQLQDLLRGRGAAASEFMRKGRSEERQYAAEAKAFGLKAAEPKLKADAARLANKRNRALARTKARLERERAKGAKADQKEILRLKRKIRDSYRPPSGGGRKEKDTYGSDDATGAFSRLRAKYSKADLRGKTLAQGRAKRRKVISWLTSPEGGSFSHDAAAKAVKRRAGLKY